MFGNTIADELEYSVKYGDFMSMDMIKILLIQWKKYDEKGNLYNARGGIPDYDKNKWLEYGSKVLYKLAFYFNRFMKVAQGEKQNEFTTNFQSFMDFSDRY